MQPVSTSDVQKPSEPLPAISADSEIAIRRATSSAAYHWTLLIVCTIVVVLSFVLNTQGPEQVVVPIIERPLPGLCMSKRMTGLDCPGCGMTRSFISMAHGDVPAAWRFNPAGILFFVVVAAQIPLRSWELWRHYHRQHPLPLWRLHGVLWVVVAALLIQWGIKLAGYLVQAAFAWLGR